MVKYRLENAIEKAVSCTNTTELRHLEKLFNKGKWTVESQTKRTAHKVRERMEKYFSLNFRNFKIYC